MYARVLQVCLLLFLSACAAGRATRTEAPAAALGTYDRVVVRVTADLPDSDSEVKFLEGSTTARLKSRGLYPEVVAASRAPRGDRGIELAIRVTRLSKVDPSARALLAPLAGQDKIVVVAELVDIHSGARVGAFEVQGVSEAFLSGPSAADVYQAIDKVVEEIVGYFVEHR